jgi:hypothetical protein
MYYVAELGWQKRNNKYAQRCRVGVEQVEEEKYCVYGMLYYPNSQNRWVMNPNSIWQPPGGYLLGALKKNKKVRVQHRSLQSIVTATVIEVYPVERPKGITSPLAR